MPFSALPLHSDILRGLKELGFARPTKIQADAIPPALAGRDVLACASTGSGKTAAFLIPIIEKLIPKPRGRTRALVLTPTRELASQIVEQLSAIAVHTPVTAAAVIGGVAMGPQEHALRSGVDVVVATPGRLLDHLRSSYAKFDALEHLVLDEADRMLDMGFLPEIRKILRHLPAKRQTQFFSATMPGPIRKLAEEMLHSPATINLERTALPAVGITQAVYPVAQELKSSLFLTLLQRGEIEEALVFTRTKHRANRLAEFLVKRGIAAERIHGNRSQTQRTAALAGFKSGKHRVLVATDIAARGIDVEALGHVVNFDVPLAPEDYIHRVGRTGRAELTGEAYTLAAPDEDGELRAIERAIGRQLPRVTVPGFDYTAKPAAQLEVPLKERIAEIRKRKADDRQRAAANAARREAAQGDRERGAARKGDGARRGAETDRTRTNESGGPRGGSAGGGTDAERGAARKRPSGQRWGPRRGGR